MAIPTNIPVKSNTNQTRIDGTQPTTKARTTEVEALKPPRTHHTVLGRAFEDDHTSRILCEYRIGRNLGFTDNALIIWVAGRVGCFTHIVRQTIVNNLLE